jgi:hypothetical protein
MRYIVRQWSESMVSFTALAILATPSFFAGYAYALRYYPHVEIVHHDTVMVAFFLWGIFFSGRYTHKTCFALMVSLHPGTVSNTLTYIEFGMD